jgi:hypothetical protein
MATDHLDVTDIDVPAVFFWVGFPQSAPEPTKRYFRRFGVSKPFRRYSSVPPRSIPMLTRRIIPVLCLMLIVACTDQNPIEVPETILSPQEAEFSVLHQSSDLLTDIDVTDALPADVTDAILSATLTITELALQEGQLLVSGVLEGTSILGDFSQAFTDVLLDLTKVGPGASCRILFLDLGPVFLDLLGLEVDLSPVELEIRAVPGPGNLLGNLLCTVTHLLDVPGAVVAIINLIDRINQILG